MEECSFMYRGNPKSVKVVFSAVTKGDVCSHMNDTSSPSRHDSIFLKRPYTSFCKKKALLTHNFKAHFSFVGRIPEDSWCGGCMQGLYRETSELTDGTGRSVPSAGMIPTPISRASSYDNGDSSEGDRARCVTGIWRGIE